MTSPVRLRVPEPEQVQDSLAMMLGRDVVVRDDGPAPPDGAVPVAVAAFLAGSETAVLAGCTWVDLGLGAAIGAATVVDPGQGKACRDSGRLAPDFAANLREVLLVTGGLLFGADGGTPHLRALELLEDGLAEDTLGLLADPRQGGFYRVEVADYGDGLMGFALV